MVSSFRAAIGMIAALSLVTVLSLSAQVPANQNSPVKSSYQFPVAEEDFQSLFARTSAEQPAVRQRQMDLLNQRYDLGDRPDPNVKMSRGKPIQAGVRVKMAAGVK
jgi:hypothetical protein